MLKLLSTIIGQNIDSFINEVENLAYRGIETDLELGEPEIPIASPIVQKITDFAGSTTQSSTKSVKEKIK